MYFFCFCMCTVFLHNLLFKENRLPKNSQVKMRKKLVRCAPCSGETTNRKCLFASIFLNVSYERGEVERDRRSPRLSGSHPQSYCSLEEK